jgi:hypothetical protein
VVFWISRRIFLDRSSKYIDHPKKQSLDSFGKPQYLIAAVTGPAPLNYFRAAQHIFATIAISFIACAIDRNILIPGITSEEKAILGSISTPTYIALDAQLVSE